MQASFHSDSMQQPVGGVLAESTRKGNHGVMGKNTHLKVHRKSTEECVCVCVSTQLHTSEHKHTCNTHMDTHTQQWEGEAPHVFLEWYLENISAAQEEKTLKELLGKRILIAISAFTSTDLYYWIKHLLWRKWEKVLAAAIYHKPTRPGTVSAGRQKFPRQEFNHGCFPLVVRCVTSFSTTNRLLIEQLI